MDWYDTALGKSREEWLVLESSPGEVLASGEPLDGRRYGIMALSLGRPNRDGSPNICFDPPNFRHTWLLSNVMVTVLRPADSWRWRRRFTDPGRYQGYEVKLAFEDGYRETHKVSVYKDEARYDRKEVQVKMLQFFRELAEAHGDVLQIEFTENDYP